MTGAGREPDVTGFALHGDEPAEPVLGRLVERGLHDELKGTAYAIVEGVDGRTHHLRFSDLEMTGDAQARRDRRGARLRGRERTPAPLARHAIGLHDRGAGHGARRDLARPPASRQGACDSAAADSAPRCATRWTGGSIIWSRRAWPGGRASGSSSPAISSTPCGGASWTRPSAKLAAETGLAVSPVRRRRARRRRLSPARHARVRPVRHDRRWSRLSARAVAAGAGAKLGQHVSGTMATRRCRLEFRAKAGPRENGEWTQMAAFPATASPATLVAWRRPSAGRLRRSGVSRGNLSISLQTRGFCRR